MKDDRGELDLTRQIDDLKSKIKVYESDLFNSKKLRFNGKLHDIRRMEVHENTHPIIGYPGHKSHRLVLKTEKPSTIILPEKLQKDY